MMSKDGKNYNIASINPLTKTNKEIYDEIWNTILSKNNDMLIGFTNENQQEARSYVKELKNK